MQTIIRYKFYLTNSEWTSADAYLAGVKDLLYYMGNFTFFLLLFKRLWYMTLISVDTTQLSSKIDPASELIMDYTSRSIENAINIAILWLPLKVNNEKYICLCKCWHKCILKFCMKEDPNMIREGFVVNDNEHGLLNVNDHFNEQKDDEYVEGPGLVVADQQHVKVRSNVGSVEGHDILMTLQ